MKLLIKARPLLCPRTLTKTLRIMQVTIFLLIAFCLTASARSDAQTVTISVKDQPLQTVLKAIKRQTNYTFFADAALLRKGNKVTLQLKDVPLEEALEACFKNQPFTYSIEGRIITVQPKAPPAVVDGINNSTIVANSDIKSPLITIRGRITNEVGKPVVATVLVKGTNNGTTSNNDGYFELKNVDENAMLVISGVSLEIQEVNVNSRATIDVSVRIKMKEEEEIVVAYNKTTAQKNVSALTVVKGDQIQSLPNRSFDKSLQGLVPGLLVTSGTGQPGGGLSSFVLRGIATGDNGLNGSTLRNPLIVIDGIPVSQDAQQLYFGATTDVATNNPMAQINPSDIESISVLKDAAAIALYGSKASNGVILITTKKGKAGRTVCNYRHQTDLAQRLKGKVELLNQQEYLDLLYETYRNTTPGITDATITTQLKSIFPTRADGSFYPDQNLIDEVYNEGAATISNEVSASGGNEKSNFYLNAEWTKQNGVFKKTGYDRKSVRYNFENRLTPYLKIGMNNLLSYNEQDYGGFKGDFPFFISSLGSPLNPIRKENGDYIYYYTVPFNLSNPIASMEFNSSTNTTYRALSKLYAGIDFLKHFSLTSTIGIDYLMTEAKEKFDLRLYDPATFTTGKGRIEEGNFRNANIINTNLLKYSTAFSGGHSLNILMGEEAQVLTQKNVRAIGQGLLFPDLNQIDNTSTRSSSGNYFKQTLLSYFGQVNYDYNNKYFVSLSSRLDGSSKFGQDQKYGTYWSLGAGWVLSEASFLKPAAAWLNYLKLRSSIGEAGNSAAIDRYTKYDRLQSSSYMNGQAIYPGSSPANPDIKWEETFTVDGGLEARFLNNRINVNADIYNRKTKDLIYTINLVTATGYSTVLANIGDIRNNGVEISIGADVIKNKNFKWNITANLSTNRNKLVRANQPLATVGSTLANAEGQNFNSFYLRQWAGVDPTTGLGMFIDSTGKPNTNFNAAKPQFVGKPQPDGFGSVFNSFSYKGFTFLFRLYYQYGFQIYDNIALTNDGSYPYANQDKRALDRWQKPGDIAANPKRTLNSSQGFYASTRRLVDGDFIRLQDILLDYNFPDALSRSLHLSNLKLYVQASNVAIWSKFPGMDVSNVDVQGSTPFAYPNVRTYSIGLNVSF